MTFFNAHVEKLHSKRLIYGHVGRCACEDLIKRKRSKRKLVGSPKEYLDWLDARSAQLARALAPLFRDEVKHTADWVRAQIEATKAKSKKGEWDYTGKKDIQQALQGRIKNAAKDQGRSGLRQVGSATRDNMEQVDDWAVEYAQARSASLIEDISKTTRAQLRDLISDAIQEQWSDSDLIDALRDDYAFSEQRAETIARTEMAFAHVEGNMAGWRISGVVSYKQSILGGDHDLDDVCDDNADVGAIPLDEDFPSGDQGPPYHPNCICDVIPLVGEDDEESDNAD